MNATSQDASPHVGVGVGVIVVNHGRILLGQRTGAHGAGTWALPGGHLEYGESVEDCARREVMEECGLAIQEVTPGPYVNTIFAAEGKHYVTLYVVALSESEDAKLLEPEKCSCWQWFPWNELPTPLFPPFRTLSQSGFVPRNIER